MNAIRTADFRVVCNCYCVDNAMQYAIIDDEQFSTNNIKRNIK